MDYVELVQVVDIKADAIAKAFLRDIVCRHGAPQFLHSDRGANFLSSIVKATCQLMNTKKTRTTSYHLQCNGQTERCMSFILASLSKQLDRVHNVWDRYLHFTQFAHNTSSCLDSTTYTPAFLVYGRHLRTPIDHELPVLHDVPKSAQQYVAELIPIMETTRREAELTLISRKTAM
ncbi:uncharacterized protein LOC117104601 [Anneissia japonica]|uniref:uncharacterized protein LOC117104601 n=1 Tax=Anneissia japonica TaxID=1529436 RepID=UPI00142581D8|nr:uncharacterized protein LOC117104601 [Anneissia japonica]